MESSDSKFWSEDCVQCSCKINLTAHFILMQSINIVQYQDNELLIIIFISFNSVNIYIEMKPFQDGREGLLIIL